MNDPNNSLDIRRNTEGVGFLPLVEYPWVEMASRIWLNSKTLIVRKQHLSHWVRWMEDNKKQGVIDFQDIIDYLYEMRDSSQGMRKSAIKLALKNHPSVLHDIRARSMIEEMFKDIKTMKPIRNIGESSYLTLEEVKGVLNDLYKEDTLRSLRAAALIEALFQTAARISELLEATHDDCKVLSQHVELPVKGKGSKMRVTHMSLSTYEMIRGYYGKSGPLFKTEANKPLPREQAHKIVKRRLQSYVEKHGLPKRNLGPHSLRHSKAMELLGKGMGIKAVSKYLGHSDESTTLKYYVHQTPTASEVLADL